MKYPLGKPLYIHMTEGRHAANAMKKLPKVRAKRKRRTVLYPDSCECTPRERKTCQHSCAPLYRGKPGVKLMQSHSPAALAGVVVIPHNTGKSRVPFDFSSCVSHDAKVVPGMMVAGSLMGPDEYGTLGGPDDFPDGGRPRPWQFQIAEYEVRESRKGNGQWGIYLRDFNVRLAVFSPNSFALRDALGRGFDAAHVLKKKRVAEFKEARMPRGWQHRQAAQRKANKGWYSCNCGQWVNDKTSPCSVCKPKRKPRKKK